MSAAEVAQQIPVAPRIYAGSEWLKRQRPAITPFGERVADLLGEWQRGIYHIDRAVRSKKSDFESAHSAVLCVSEHFLRLGTVDSNELTRLVFLAHDYGIRVYLRPSGFGYLKFTFHQRDRSDLISEGHPTLERAVARHRAAYPSQEGSR